MDQINLESSIDSEPIGSTFAVIGQRISNWTSNLLATAVVIIIALVCGKQLVSYWLPTKSSELNSAFDLADAWPTLDSCSLEFGSAPFQLVREQATGDEAAVISILQDRCRLALEQSAIPAAALGPEEKRMLKNSADWIPIEQRVGKWRIFRSQNFDAKEAGQTLVSQLPIVLGIRDDCAMHEESPTPGFSSRLVVWGIALAGEQENLWTTFVGQASASEASSEARRNWLPGFARRTMAISDQRGGSMIGFAGGNPADTMEFYNRLAQENGWTMSDSWQQSNQTWAARFTPGADSSIAGIQVQLHLNHNERTSGILLLQTK